MDQLKAVSCRVVQPAAVVWGYAQGLTARLSNLNLDFDFWELGTKPSVLAISRIRDFGCAVFEMPFKAPTISTLARQTIRSAFEDLDRTITPVDSRAFSRTTLQHVRQAALEIENQLAARQSLRNMRRLEPLFKGMEHYAKVMDVLCNGTPYLAWVWAPIILILRVSSEYVEAFEHIIAGYSKIAESLVRFEILGDAFRSKMDFQSTIAVFYADILQFHKHAYKFVKRSGGCFSEI